MSRSSGIFAKPLGQRGAVSRTESFTVRWHKLRAVKLLRAPRRFSSRWYNTGLRTETLT